MLNLASRLKKRPQTIRQDRLASSGDEKLAHPKSCYGTSHAGANSQGMRQHPEKDCILGIRNISDPFRNTQGLCFADVEIHDNRFWNETLASNPDLTRSEYPIDQHTQPRDVLFQKRVIRNK